MEKIKGKHMKKERRKLRISNGTRFWSFMLILLGIGSAILFNSIQNEDMSGPLLMILFGLYAYLCSYDEEEE